jgi:hypothetical protein
MLRHRAAFDGADIRRGVRRIWSASGDIDAGRRANSTDVFSQSIILCDAFGNLSLTPTVPMTGAGISTLAPIAEITAGDVNLVVPLGIINAGEANTRVSGKCQSRCPDGGRCGECVGRSAAGLPVCR